MNPLSPSTYHFRHKGSTLLLLALITLATLGLYVTVSVLDSIPMRANFHYLTRVSRVYPVAGTSVETAVVSQIQAHPGVARVVRDNGLSISPPTLIGLDNLRLLGVAQDEAQYLMDHMDVRLKEGRLFEPRTNEIILSEEVARALNLKIGDQIDHSIDERYFKNILTPMVLVGILEGDPATGSGPSVRVGFVSYEYLNSHELYSPRPLSLLVVPHEGSKAVVDTFLETAIPSSRTEVETFGEISKLMTLALRGLHVLFGVVNCLIAVIVALVVGVVNRIAMTRRLVEFGLLHAVGYHRRRLIGRLALETSVVAATGWGAGLILAWLLLAWLRASFYYPKGMELDLGNLAPLWFVVPIPLVVIAFATLSARRIFARFDAVSIIERGKMDMEAKGQWQTLKRSSTRPLSPLTFYLRHRRRGITLVATMALMILGVAFPGFLASTVIDAMDPSFEYLRYVSRVTSGVRGSVDPGVVAQIRSNPAVTHVVPARQLSLTVLIPPGSGTNISIYGVSEDDMPVLMDQFGIKLEEGRLPNPRSNEIVISEAATRNRGLHVGDTVGLSGQDKEESDPTISDDIPTEMVIVGLLSSNDLWLGFASLPYLESHELTSSRPVHLLLLPAEGRKGELDTWLEDHVASAQTNVTTYATERQEARQNKQSLLLLFAAVESVIAIVAAIALAALNYIFFAQRRDEFGILHAVGRNRPWLVLRTVKETGSVVTLAWLIGAAICVTGLVIAQATIYTPRGLSLNFFSLSPWLFTLPIPLSVIAASAGTIARMLSTLDPVSIVERR